jgi:hypothetical protein
VVCLSKLFSSIFDLLPLRSTWVCYLCVQGSLPCMWSSTKAPHQIWFVLEVKRSLKLFLHVLYATPVWLMPPVKLSIWPVWPVTTTGLIGGHWQLKLSGRKVKVGRHAYSQPPPISRSFQVRPTRRPVNLSVGLPDLTCGPKDEKTAWRASQGSPDRLRQLG